MSPARAEALELLRYPREWDALGLPDPELLALQLRTLRTEEHPSTEHYRYAAFQALLPEAVASDERLEQYLVLVDADPDTGMARSALIELLLRAELTDPQFERVAQHRWFVEDPRLPRRHRLLRALRREGPTEQLLEQCLREEDPRVHEALLALRLPRPVLEQLALTGLTRRIRNVAAARLRARP